jgi:hypothetical protein
MGNGSHYLIEINGRINLNQKECINVKFSEGLGIFDNHYGYPEIDDQETYNGPTGKVVDIQVAHAGKLQKRYKLCCIGILDYATKAAMASAVARTETNPHCVEERIFFDHGLPADRVAIRLYSFNGKEASDSCLT